jgi:hypothetical protein
MSEPDRLQMLGQLVAERQDAALDASPPDEVARQRLAQQASARTSPRRGTIRPALAAALAAAAIFVVVAAVWKTKTAVSHMTFNVGDPPARGEIGRDEQASPSNDLSIRFSEGTTVVLRPAGRAHVVSIGPRGAQIALESGRARLEVTPRPDGDWTVRAGPFTVHVRGTKFEIGYDPAGETFSLELYEGHVVVSGCEFGGGRDVEAGERVTASCAPKEPTAVVNPPTATVEESRHQESVPPQRRISQRTWLELAHEGHYAEAFELARDGFEDVCRSRGAGEVSLLGDVARLSGHAAEARRAYIAVRERFAGSGEAATAAFALGRLALGGRSDPIAARQWLETYLRERPSGPLASAALGRLMELSVEGGDARGAASLAREYLQRYPTGAHAAEAQKVLGSQSPDPRP